MCTKEKVYKMGFLSGDLCMVYFLKTARGGGGGARGHYSPMHVSQIESNRIGSCEIYVLFCFCVCLFVCFFGFSFGFPSNRVPPSPTFKKTLANAAC